MTDAPKHSPFDRPENFINRELSWLEFNVRVLQEAIDPTQPLLERVRFLSIVGTNLDEFFEVRIAGLETTDRPAKACTSAPDHMTASEVLVAATKRARELVAEQYRCWNDDILPALNKENIFIHDVDKLPASARCNGRTTALRRRTCFPPSRRWRSIRAIPSRSFSTRATTSSSSSPRADGSETLTAIVQIPRVLPRLLLIPEEPARDLGPGLHYFFLQDLVRHYLAPPVHGLEVRDAHAFRMTRNSDLYIDEEEAENLLHTIEEELRRLNKGNAVRLEVQAGTPPEVEKFLLENFRLTEADLYRLPGPINFLHLEPLFFSDAFPRLRDRPFQPVLGKAVPLRARTFSRSCAKQDVLLHHPYESFQSVVDLLERAALDPQVLAIKMTLYRTGTRSAIVQALLHAADKGKQVTVLVELKARFDEANNIRWARQMEEAGVHVVYGLVGLKTHCKMMMIVRRDEDRIRLYTHLGTGNYNATTARFYTDLSLLTTAPELTAEVAVVFNNLTGLSEYSGGKKLMVAPFELRKRFHRTDRDRERDIAREGGKGRIIVKLNSLVDEEIIVALYEASAAGVKIDLIVRGVCSSAAGDAGHQREHPGGEHHRAVPGTQPHLLFRQRGQAGSCTWAARTGWAQFRPARGGGVPRGGRGVTHARNRRNPARVFAATTSRRANCTTTARMCAAIPPRVEPTQQAQLMFRQLARKTQGATSTPGTV